MNKRENMCKRKTTMFHLETKVVTLKRLYQEYVDITGEIDRLDHGAFIPPTIMAKLTSNPTVPVVIPVDNDIVYESLVEAADIVDGKIEKLESQVSELINSVLATAKAKEVSSEEST